MMTKHDQRRISVFRPQAVLVLLCALFTTGCQAMTTGETPPRKMHVPTDERGVVRIDTSKPIPFERHNFSAVTYDTYGARVYYDGRWEKNEEPNEKKLSSSSVKNYPDNLRASTLSIANFPPPAKLSWRSKDGTPYEAEIDLGAIFKDDVVLHKVPQEQLPPILTAPIFPDIILEINDRTVNVWMRARVPTKDMQIPGNQYSYFRNDMMLAWTKTY